MKNKLFLLLVIIAVMGIAVVLNYGTVGAQGDGSKMKVVVISGDPPQFDVDEVIYSFPQNVCDTLRFDNIAGFSVALLNDSTPVGPSSKTPTPGGDIILNNTSGKYLFCCPVDEGQWRFMVGKQSTPGVYTDTLRVIVTCHQTPTLTEWGLIILVALLIGSGVFVMLRRRKAAVPA
jgi:hypothetical protein